MLQMIFLLALKTSKPSISVFQSIDYDPVKLVYHGSSHWEVPFPGSEYSLVFTMIGVLLAFNGKDAKDARHLEIQSTIYEPV